MSEQQNQNNAAGGQSAFSGLVGRRRRKKWLRPLATIPVYEAYDRLMGMNKRQLKLTIEAMESCTTTNCWWGDYQAARILLPIAKSR